MGKGGEISSTLPSRMAVKSLIEIEDKIGDVGDSVRRCLPAGAIAEDELLLSMTELLVIAIEVGSWSFLRALGFREVVRAFQ